jgi:hypothetical protein
MTCKAWATLPIAMLLLTTLPPVSAQTISESTSVAARMDVITHNEIIVNATPEAIWPHAMRMDDWKKGVKLVSISGKPDELGASFKAVYGSEVALFHATNVEIARNRTRTIRLNALDGALLGYASLRLVPRGSATLVQYDVYSAFPTPPEVADASLVVQARKAALFIANSRKRFGEELATLKAMAEARRR